MIDKTFGDWEERKKKNRRNLPPELRKRRKTVCRKFKNCLGNGRLYKWHQGQDTRCGAPIAEPVLRDAWKPQFLGLLGL